MTDILHGMNMKPGKEGRRGGGDRTRTSGVECKPLIMTSLSWGRFRGGLGGPSGPFVWAATIQSRANMQEVGEVGEHCH